jgi:hypothetical protein
MLEEQSNAHLKMLQWKIQNNIEAYKEARRKARKVCRKKKQDYEEGKLEEIQEKYKKKLIKTIL